MLAGGALLTGQLADAAPMILGSAYLSWAAGLAATAIAVLVSTVWGIGPGIAWGVAGMLAGALIADKSILVRPPARMADARHPPARGDLAQRPAAAPRTARSATCR